MRLKAFALAIALMLSWPSFAENGEKTVWRIGVFDGSSGELADGEPHQAVSFMAGHDEARTGWYAFAPVAIEGKPADPAAAWPSNG